MKFFKILFFYYFPAISWMILIFWLSSFHSIRTGTDLVFWEIILRKIAHAGEFFVLAWLFFRIVHDLYEVAARKSFWLSLGLIFLYALSDEIHQFFINGREGRLLDIFFDVMGSYLGLYLAKRGMKINSLMVFFTIVLLFFSLLIYKAWESVLVYGKYFSFEVSTENYKENKKDNQKKQTFEKIENERSKEVIEEKTQEKDISQKFTIANVPFTSQSPYAKWDEVHEESCEEASIVMIEYFKKGKKLDKEIADREILSLVDFQNKSYGDYKDTNAQETALLAYEFYGLDFEVVYDFSKKELKKYISLGKPIIIPAAGRELKNPFFTSPGPLYHNLVLIGYNGNTIITNDPGTKRGEKYEYNLDTLYSAIHDFPGKKEDILKGRKAMLILK